MTTATPAAGELWFARLSMEGLRPGVTIPALVLIGNRDDDGRVYGAVKGIHRDPHGSVPLRFATWHTRPIDDPSLTMIAPVVCPTGWLPEVAP